MWSWAVPIHAFLELGYSAVKRGRGARRCCCCLEVEPCPIYVRWLLLLMTSLIPRVFTEFGRGLWVAAIVQHRDKSVATALYKFGALTYMLSAYKTALLFIVYITDQLCVFPQKRSLAWILIRICLALGMRGVRITTLTLLLLQIVLIRRNFWWIISDPRWEEVKWSDHSGHRVTCTRKGYSRLAFQDIATTSIIMIDKQVNCGTTRSPRHGSTR
jgi:hypothetical protein